MLEEERKKIEERDRQLAEERKKYQDLVAQMEAMQASKAAHDNAQPLKNLQQPLDSQTQMQNENLAAAQVNAPKPQMQQPES